MEKGKPLTQTRATVDWEGLPETQPVLPAAVIATEKNNQDSSQRWWGSDPAVVEKSLKRVGGAGVGKGESTFKETEFQETRDSASQCSHAGDLPGCLSSVDLEVLWTGNSMQACFEAPRA